MVTLVTVTYNAGRTIERTLESVETQTYSQIQHIIMDGGSKDDTVVLAEAYKDRVMPKGIDVKVISEPDKGLYDAMNKAIRLVEGDYVCFLNAGDKLHDESVLQRVVDAAGFRKAAVIYGDTDIVDESGKKLRARRLSPPERLTWRSFKDGMLVCHQSFYASRAIIQEYDLTYRFSADFDWCIRCMRKGEELGLDNVNTHATLTDYLSEGMTTANHKASLKERFRIMARHYGILSAVIQHLWFVIRAVVKK